MRLVVDASVAVTAALAADGFSLLAGHDLVSPPLMWSEARSALHELVWRGEVDPADGEDARAALEDAPVEKVLDERLGPAAWTLATELGWAKTYDAEYLAAARLLGCRVVTLDRRLHRGAGRLDLVVSPHDVR